MADRWRSRTAPLLVALLLVTLAGLFAWSSWVAIRHFRDDAVAMGRLYSGVFAGLNDPEPRLVCQVMVIALALGL